MKWRFAVLAVATTVTLASARAPLLSGASLRPTASGVLLELTVRARDRDGDTLRGVWTAGARAKLMHCQPRCVVVESLPIRGVTQLGVNTPYRVVLGGRFEPGAKVGLILSFAGGNASVEATVSRDTARIP